MWQVAWIHLEILITKAKDFKLRYGDQRLGGRVVPAFGRKLCGLHMDPCRQ